MRVRFHAVMLLLTLLVLAGGVGGGLFFWEKWHVPLTPDEVASARTWFGICAAVAAVAAVGSLLLAWRAVRSAGGFRLGWTAITVLWGGALAAGVVTMDGYHWSLRIAHLPSMNDLPVDSTDYTIEKLPFAFRASYVRGRDVYFSNAADELLRADDADPGGSLRVVGRHGIDAASMLHVSGRGTIFVSGRGGFARSGDGGVTWARPLGDWSCWRMAEDPRSGTLFVGTYVWPKSLDRPATLFRSDDDGVTWELLWRDPRLHHVHSIAVDAATGRLFLSTGDTPSKGHGYSDDGGRTWRWLMTGDKQAHTDVAVSGDYVFWGSDDRLGRIIRTSRVDPDAGRALISARHHNIWFLVAEGEQVYAGTFLEFEEGISPVLVVSHDHGCTWQKLLAGSDVAEGARALDACSRRLSDAGWLYFTVGGKHGFRVRRNR